ncbi:MAG: hypothetical protein ABEH81_01215 [Halopenitus sp.]
MTEKHIEFLKNEEWLYHKYHVEGYSQSEIADMVGCIYETVGNYMERHEIPTKLDQTPEDRFWDKVDIGNEDECWEWKPKVGENRQPTFCIDGNSEQAIRLVYQWEFGDPGDRRVVRSCENSICMNPNHLELGGRKVEIKDRGELHGNSKLTREEVEQLKKELESGAKTQTELAEEYGVSRMQVSNIKRGVNWSHV